MIRIGAKRTNWMRAERKLFCANTQITHITDIGGSDELTESNGHKLSFRCSHFTHFICLCSLTFMCGPLFVWRINILLLQKQRESAKHSCANVNLFEIHMAICIFRRIYFWIRQKTKTVFIAFATWTWIIPKSRCKMVAASWMKAATFDGITTFFFGFIAQVFD